MNDYKIPENYREMITKNLLFSLKTKLKKTFQTTNRKDFETNYDWAMKESTQGWDDCLNSAMFDCGLLELKRYYNSLGWEDAESFDSEVTKIAVEMGVIKDVVFDEVNDNGN